MPSVAERIAQGAEHIAGHDAHGYSQPNRDGDGTIETITYSDGTLAIIHGGDYDCSEDVRVCVNCALTGSYDGPIAHMWTGNEDDMLTSNGFARMPFDWDDTRRGDILLVSGHTGIALGDGMQADARGDEYGGITGPNQGDQTGHEIEVRDLQWYWTWTYRYEGPEPEQRPTVSGDGMEAIIRPDLKEYLVYVSGGTYRKLSHPDQAEAVRMAYRTCNGSEIPQFELGTPNEPWGTRLLEALKEV